MPTIKAKHVNLAGNSVSIKYNGQIEINSGVLQVYHQEERVGIISTQHVTNCLQMMINVYIMIYGENTQHITRRLGENPQFKGKTHTNRSGFSFTV